MPFHHLIPAALLGLNSSFLHQDVTTCGLDKSSPGKRCFWQVLAERGISAREAALLDDSVEYSFIELVGNQFIQVNWEALHYDALAGCAELYLAEMFLCKERVYKTGNQVPDSLEFSSDELAGYLPKKIFYPFVENVAKLFLSSLSANYTLTASLIDFDLIDSDKPQKARFFSDLFKSYLTETANRVKSRSGREATTKHKQKGAYTITLADYWRHWQTAARLANFDFDFLHTLDDAHAVRFYELTKLRRVPNNRTDTQTDDWSPVSKKLDIEYEQFAALMPLPRMSDERDIKRQINQLIKPLRAAGYIKSFAIKPNEQDTSARGARLVFRFND